VLGEEVDPADVGGALEPSLFVAVAGVDRPLFAELKLLPVGKEELLEVLLEIEGLVVRAGQP